MLPAGIPVICQLVVDVRFKFVAMGIGLDCGEGGGRGAYAGQAELDIGTEVQGCAAQRSRIEFGR